MSTYTYPVFVCFLPSRFYTTFLTSLCFYTLAGISVGASGFTLVAISLERYFAICRPLASRRWQTRSHAYKIVGVCWLLSAIIFIPIPVTTRHTSLAPGRALCREIWGNESLERAYTVFLDVVLLLIPLCLMTGAYTRIMITLYTGIRHKNGKLDT